MGNKACHECGITRSEAAASGIEFTNKGNWCKRCQTTYNKAYGSRNRATLSEYERSPERLARRKANREASPETFIKFQCSIAKVRRRIKGAGGKRDIRCSLVGNDVINLYYKQNGLCAITRLPMVYHAHDPMQISIDRIDSNGHYDINNVQLVCKWINLAKSNTADDEFRQVLDKLRLLWETQRS